MSETQTDMGCSYIVGKRSLSRAPRYFKVYCPNCRARPGEPCQKPHTGASLPAHAERLRYARKAGVYR